MTTKNIIFWIVLTASFGFFAYRVRRLIILLKVGKPDNRFDNPAARLKNMLVVAIGQSKILREPVAGFMHAFIFWGFVVLLSAVLESIGEGLIPGFSFHFLGALYGPLTFMQDLFGGFVILSVIVALYRRYVVRPKRLEVDLHGKIDATLILFVIFLII
ncbi:MAG: Fe-S oxidoreductase, partial [Ignavibacteriales bacterium]|nr:Fe-S oxidoreductase [Ignavibacteriales bacterium]